MNELQKMGDMQLIFGAVLVLANRMDTIMERALSKYGVTAKQWFLWLVLNSLFDYPPTMKELAREMGSSHQNIKQVALKLQDKGLVALVKDKNDARVTRLHLSDKSREFWTSISEDSAVFMQDFYKNIDSSDLGRMCAAMAKLLENLNDLERKYEREASVDAEAG
jgi:DNA-binding MarR family transcriptional regulator